MRAGPDRTHVGAEYDRDGGILGATGVHSEEDFRAKTCVLTNSEEDFCAKT